jgi:hypothetical protein
MKSSVDIRHLICWLLLCLFCIAVNAQKLPNVQTASLRAPANVKIDGKATEWGAFQAYHKATEIFYLLANDDDNLYLLIQANDINVINKMMGGVSFIIQGSKSSKDKHSINITYPVNDRRNALFFPGKRKGIIQDTSANAMDTLRMMRNQQLGKSHKSIMITGVPGLDTILSAYNDDGVKAVSLFDKKLAYIYELSVSLKHLGLSTAKPTKFFYHISFNGPNSRITAPTNIVVTPGDARAEMIQQSFDRSNAIIAAQAAPTDFWGEYILR